MVWGIVVTVLIALPGIIFMWRQLRVSRAQIESPEELQHQVDKIGEELRLFTEQRESELARQMTGSPEADLQTKAKRNKAALDVRSVFLKAQRLHPRMRLTLHPAFEQSEINMILYGATRPSKAETGRGLNEAAIVNGDPIYMSEVDKQLEWISAQHKTAEQKKAFAQQKRQIQKQILNILIDQKLYEQQAEKLGVKVTNQEVENEVNRTKKLFSSEAEFAKALKDAQMTLDDLREFTKNRLLQERVNNKVVGKITVTDQEMQDYYEKNKDQFKEPEQVKVSHILVKTEDEAKKIREEIVGGLDFAEAAKKYSTEAATKRKGGDLGFVQKGVMAAEFDQAAFALDVGQVSQPVKTQFGWHLIKMFEQKEARDRSFDEIKASLERMLKAQTESDIIRMWLDQTKADSDIRFMDPSIKPEMQQQNGTLLTRIRNYITAHKTAVIVTVMIGLGTSIVGGLVKDQLVETVKSRFTFRPTSQTSTPARTKTETQRLYGILQKINTDLNVDFVESFLGKPAISKALPSQLRVSAKDEHGTWTTILSPLSLEGYKRRVYVHEKFFVQLFTDPDGTVIAYAVSSRKADFNPRIPLTIYRGGDVQPEIGNLKLGEMRLSALKGPYPQEIHIVETSKFLSYVERSNFGNPGYYKDYVFALLPVPSELKANTLARSLLRDLSRRSDWSPQSTEIRALRSTLNPNTYCIVSRNNEQLLKYLTADEWLWDTWSDTREFGKASQ